MEGTTRNSQKGIMAFEARLVTKSKATISDASATAAYVEHCS